MTEGRPLEVMFHHYSREFLFKDTGIACFLGFWWFVNIGCQKRLGKDSSANVNVSAGLKYDLLERGAVVVVVILSPVQGDC
jgi:hypothetical protein